MSIYPEHVTLYELYRIIVDSIESQDTPEEFIREYGKKVKEIQRVYELSDEDIEFLYENIVANESQANSKTLLNAKKAYEKIISRKKK
ncbi:hypothetical protein ACI1IY_004479 [Vibrio vulnificus]|uniref:hypothetical protein n=1 Tax=Vibrio cholerae TaxID=666 RepID=UPI000BA9B90A|nr:hypothetical protein [Vibrio cholerae]MCU8133488.1 hypothetical protein [Vibrio vulnificus]PAS27045.1 hypothetical protein CGT71_18565 [Vibrio cholerae]HDZ9230651.1 hypothetical protein [Vibrio cholerae]